MNTPNGPATLVLARAEKRILDQLSFARSTAKRPARWKYVINLAAEWFTKERPTGLRQTLSMLRDAFDRGADEAALLGIADELRLEIQSWYELKRGIPQTDWSVAHLSEEHIEGLQEDAELGLCYTKSPGTAQRFIQAARNHILAIHGQIKAACVIRDGVTR